MNEVFTPTLVTSTYRTIPEALQARVVAAPRHAAFDIPTAAGTWRQVSTRDFVFDVRRLAKGLIAHGIQPGDRVVIFCATQYAWTLADLAISYAGAVIVPIYDTAAPAQVRAILTDCTPVAGFVGTSSQRDILMQACADTQIQPVAIWQADGEDFADLGAKGSEITDSELDARRSQLASEDLATIVYTSGTSGPARGVRITHGNLIHQVSNVAAAYREVVHDQGVTILVLPLAHVLARALQLICLLQGMRIGYIANPQQLLAAAARLKPTFLVVVPRILEKIRAAAVVRAKEKHLGRLFHHAEITAIHVGQARLLGCSPAWRYRCSYPVYDRLFYRRLRALFGGGLQWMLSGGAPLQSELTQLFTGIGIKVLEGYGLSETCAPLTGNLPGNTRAGTVGVPLPGARVRISETGEVLAAGPGVAAGYWNRDLDADAFVDGFFRTGDLGHFDDDGRLILTGRLDDTIVTSLGKSIAPARWQNLVERHPLVAHAVAIGAGKPHLSALIFVDPESVVAVARRRGDLELAQLTAPTSGTPRIVRATWLREIIRRQINRANAEVSRAEHIRTFQLLAADLSAHHELFTPTQKVRRAALAQLAAQLPTAGA
ncbi:MAG: AMP-dependent synthetase/ligase [Bowdeniella nasicola]|nr:AMP-dependent synthetase/ligase [Bowdeniella nasicola]